MRRRALVVFLACLTLLGARPAAAQDPTPTPADSASLDVAAMVLTPADLDVPGFLLNTGQLLSLEEIAAQRAAQNGTDAAQELQRIRNFGQRNRYHAQYAVPGASGGAPEWVVEVHVAECVDAAVAAAGLRSQLAMDDGPNVTDLPAPSLGDGAGMRQIANVSANGDVYQGMLIAFARGPVVAWTYLYERGQTPVDPARGVALGSRFVERIDAVLAGQSPGLAAMIPRVASGDGVEVVKDNYHVRDGQLFRWFGDADNSFEAQQQVYKKARDAYRFQAILNGTGFLQLQVVRLEDDDAASKLLGAVEPVSQDGSKTGGKTSKVRDGSKFGDESSVERFQDEANGRDGYIVAVRVGSLVATAIIRNPGVIPVDQILALAAEQADCLRAGACASSPSAAATALAAALLAAAPATPAGG